MINIIKPSSSTPEEIKQDLIRYMSSVDGIDPTSYFESSASLQYINLVLGVWLQLNTKLSNFRVNKYLKSAVSETSIEYLATSQLNYSPRRNIAPTHTSDINSNIVYLPAKDEQGARLTIEGNEVIGYVQVNDENYPLSLTPEPQQVRASELGYSSNLPLVVRKCVIGLWQEQDFDLTSSSFFDITNQFATITMDESKDVVDDSNTLQVLIYINDVVYPCNVVRNLIDTIDLEPSVKKITVVATTNPFGGIDINFGSSVMFGSSLQEYLTLATSIKIKYLKTVGNISELNFETVDYDKSYVDLDTFTPILTPLVNGSNKETSSSIKTLAPLASRAFGRIMNAEDFSSALNGLALIKSASCSKDFPVSYQEWIENNQYTTGDIVVYLSVTYVCKSNFTSTEPPSDDSENWISVNVQLDDNNATINAYALVGSQIPVFSSASTYALEDIVIYNTEYYELIRLDDLDSNPDENSNWEVTEPDEWVPLSQAQWELEYFTRLNFDTKLGFITAKFKEDIERIEKSYDITIVIDTNLNLEDQQALVIEILETDWYVLGCEYSSGRIVSEILELNGVSRVYIKDSNLKLDSNQYFAPNLVESKISFKSTDSSSDSYGD